MSPPRAKAGIAVPARGGSPAAVPGMAGAPGTGTAPAPRAGCPAPLRFGGAKGMLAAVGIRPRLFIAIVGPLRGSGPPVAARPPRRLRASPPRSMGGRRLRCARGPLRGWGPRSPLRRRPRPGAGPPRPAKSRRGSSAGGSGRACARLLSVSLPALCPPLRRRGRGNGDSAACGRRDGALRAFRSRPQTPPTTKGRAAPFFGNHPGVYGDFCYEGRWNRERKMRAGCLWSFQAFHLAGDEVGDGLVDLEPAFVDWRGGALSPPGFWGLMDVL